MTGEDPPHKRERRAASEPTRTKRAKTQERDQPPEERAKVFPMFRESLNRESQDPPRVKPGRRKQKRMKPTLNWRTYGASRPAFNFE